MRGDSPSTLKSQPYNCQSIALRRRSRTFAAAYALVPTELAQPAVAKAGADDQDRTGDLVLTKDALCQLSYIGLALTLCARSRPTARAGLARPAGAARLPAAMRGGLARQPKLALERERRLERETGIEPATNSLEGCDSTTELLPPSRSRRVSPRVAAPAGKARRPSFQPARSASNPRAAALRWLASRSPPAARAKVGGEGRIRTSEAARATDLQSAAFDRFATSPIPSIANDASRGNETRMPALCTQMFGFDCSTSAEPPEIPLSARYTAQRPRAQRTSGAGEGIRTPDRLITNQLLYRTELRQPRQKSYL